jgi:DNA-binding Lrp family transcriptional regulator
MPAWRFITNHAAVLILIAQHGQITVREMAHTLGLTERLIHRIIAELTADGYLPKRRVGRVNQYRVHLDMPLRRPVLQEVTIGEALQGMRVATREQTDVRAWQSRNASGEPEQRLRLQLPDITVETLLRNRLQAEAVRTRARCVREENRKVRETCRCTRASARD